MAWRLAKALEKLRQQMNEASPQRSRKSDGTIGDVAHQKAGTSDHLPNATGVVTALDITNDPENGCDAKEIAENLRWARDHRIKYVIFARQIFSSLIKPWVWRPYTGINPHATHVHVSVVPDAADCEVPWDV